MTSKSSLPLGKDALLVLFFAALCVALVCIKTGYETEKDHEVLRHPARVTAVGNRDLDIIGMTKTGMQRLTAELLSGPHKGARLTVNNHLLGRMELDEIYTVNDKLLVQYGLTPSGEPDVGTARGHYRIHLELLLLCLFAAMLILVAGMTGLKAILSFVFAALMIWKVMVPLFLRGHDPIPIALAIVAALTASISFLVGGLSKKGLVTFSGAFLGLALTAGLAILFGDLFNVHGAVRPYAETLLYAGFYNLKLTPIFISGIFIASSGAVMDLAMDIAAAMEEVKLKHPDIHFIEHIRSGLRVGRSVIGTMTTTLLLAYSSSYIFMFMFFTSQDIPPTQIFNLNYVAAEVLNTMVGSFGLVTVAPFTALIGGLVMRGDHPIHTAGK
jgi:uncharacterized membrane protein